MNSMDDEIWKPVPVEGYCDYYDVSTKGRVRSHGFHRRNRLMTLEKNNRGYMRVRLYNHGDCVRFYVHRLVAMAFIDNPNNRDQVNHKNLDKADNRLENLEWVSASENQFHKMRYRDEKIKMLEERIDQLKSIVESSSKIVRCRNCMHYDPHPIDGGVCFLPDGDGDFARWEVEPDGFCAWGKRETNNKTDDIVECCGDDRFELIAKAKAELLDATNIESSPTDMAALDSILFRCWQMGWLDQLRTEERENDGQAK